MAQGHGTDGDQRSADHERKDDPDREHPQAQGIGNGEPIEQEEEDEDIVDAQAVLGQPTGHELAGSVRAEPGPDHGAEGQGSRRVERHPRRRHPMAGHLISARTDEQVDGQQHDDSRCQGDPPDRGYLGHDKPPVVRSFGLTGGLLREQPLRAGPFADGTGYGDRPGRCPGRAAPC